MASNVWDAITGVAGAVGNVFRKTDKVRMKEQPYRVEVSRQASFPTQQNKNMLLYLGIAGVGLMMIIFMMKK